MEHQYPGAISGDENMLAELMLPDQAHVRKQDWTIFFLHKDTSEEEGKAEGAGTSTVGDRALDGATGTLNDGEGSNEGQAARAVEEGNGQDEADGGEGPPLIYVLNLVNTKQDVSAKRFGVRDKFAINRI